MKSLYYTWVFTLLFAFISLHATFVFAGEGVIDKDSIHTLKYIESISITDPHRTLRLIDETEALHLNPQYYLDHLRSVVYQNGVNMYRYAIEGIELADSLHVREKQNGVLEDAAIYETKEKEAQLVKQSARLRKSRMVILFTSCLAVLLGVLLWRTVLHMRIIKEKNITMVRTIRQQLGYKDQLYQREEEVRALREDLRQKTEGMNRLEEAMQEKEAVLRKMQEQCSEAQPFEIQPSEVQLKKAQPEEISVADHHPTTEYTDAVMRELFARVEHEIISRKLYLNPDFSKEELLRIVYIPKNRFAGLFKDYAGVTFLQYINKLRMEDAARMLSECPNYTIESVAQACGITNVRTFYRLFFDTFKMTPNDFRTIK